MNQICNNKCRTTTYTPQQSRQSENPCSTGDHDEEVKDKEDGRIPKSGAGEDERGVRMSKTRRGEKGKGHKEGRLAGGAPPFCGQSLLRRANKWVAGFGLL